MLVRIRAASLCGTDIRMYRNGHPNAGEDHPLTLGHEFAGYIAKTGSGVRGYSTGQRVAVAPNIGCGTCDLCVSGNTHLCAHYEAFGVTTDGGFAEYVRIPERAIRQGNVAPLDGNISYCEAALLEPLSCVYNGQKLTGVRPGDDVLIIGLGPIGLMHIMVAKLLGAGSVFVRDLSTERTEKACALFPEVIPVREDVKETLAGAAKQGVDVCIIAAPSPEAQARSGRSRLPDRWRASWESGRTGKTSPAGPVRWIPAIRLLPKGRRKNTGMISSAFPGPAIRCFPPSMPGSPTRIRTGQSESGNT